MYLINSESFQLERLISYQTLHVWQTGNYWGLSMIPNYSDRSIYIFGYHSAYRNSVFKFRDDWITFQAPRLTVANDTTETLTDVSADFSTEDTETEIKDEQFDDLKTDDGDSGDSGADR